MTTYTKTSIVWSKTSKQHILDTPELVSAIAAKKDSMISAGTMFEDIDSIETDATVNQINKFSNTTTAQEWLTFMDQLATSNSLTKISSRIISVTKP